MAKNKMHFNDSKPPRPVKPPRVSEPTSPAQHQPDRVKRQQKRALPQELLMQKNETVVCLKNQNLTNISQREIERYRQYMGFDLSFNRVDFSDDLCLSFKFIKFLNISHNHLEKLPHDIHHMENLTVFNVSFNKISKLPLNIHQMKHLNWMDVRGNPFLDIWNAKKNKKLGPNSQPSSNSNYDPQKFVHEIRPFMLAVKDWREMNMKRRAEEIQEYLVVCPVREPSPDDAQFDLAAEDYSDCPFNKLMETHPEKIETLLNMTKKNRPHRFSYPEDYIFSAWKQYSGTLLKCILKVTILVMTLFCLSVAFLEPKQFAQVIEHVFSPENAIGMLCKKLHSAGQSVSPLFPIREP